MATSRLAAFRHSALRGGAQHGMARHAKVFADMHVISLNWDHPLPSAVVALTLQPARLTLVAPRAAAASAARLIEIVERKGIRATMALGEEATDLDAGAPGERMRDVIESAVA